MDLSPSGLGKTASRQFDDLIFNGATTLTIASGDVTRTGFYHSLAGESGSTDNLDGIEGGTDGQLLLLRVSDDTVRITVRNNQNAGATKNILLAGGDQNGQNYVMDDFFDQLLLIYNEALDTNGAWVEVSRGVTWTATTTLPGIVELATTGETTTGTSNGRAVTPDGLSGSLYGKKYYVIKIIANDTALTTGDNKNENRFVMPDDFAGMNLVEINVHVFTASTSGLPSFQLRNVTQGQDILSVNVTIDQDEKDSNTAATGETIDTAQDDYTAGDELQIDVDAAGTDTKGSEVRLTYQTP